MEDYGSSENFLTFLYSYVNRRTQSVNINNVKFFSPMSHKPPFWDNCSSTFFLNEPFCFCFIKDAQLLSFTDDNTIATFLNSVDELITDLQKESENAIDSFRSNEMVINADKFQSIIINRLGNLKKKT